MVLCNYSIKFDVLIQILSNSNNMVNQILNPEIGASNSADDSMTTVTLSKNNLETTFRNTQNYTVFWFYFGFMPLYELPHLLRLSHLRSPQPALNYAPQWSVTSVQSYFISKIDQLRNRRRIVERNCYMLNPEYRFTTLSNS